MYGRTVWLSPWSILIAARRSASIPRDYHAGSRPPHKSVRRECQLPSLKPWRPRRGLATRPQRVLVRKKRPMAGMNGLDATRVIRKEVPESKVIIVSQNDSALAHRQAQEVDAAACVVKTVFSCDPPAHEAGAPIQVRFSAIRVTFS